MGSTQVPDIDNCACVACAPSSGCEPMSWMSNLEMSHGRPNRANLRLTDSPPHVRARGPAAAGPRSAATRTIDHYTAVRVPLRLPAARQAGLAA